MEGFDVPLTRSRLHFPIKIHFSKDQQQNRCNNQMVTLSLREAIRSETKLRTMSVDPFVAFLTLDSHPTPLGWEMSIAFSCVVNGWLPGKLKIV